VVLWRLRGDAKIVTEGSKADALSAPFTLLVRARAIA